MPVIEIPEPAALSPWTRADTDGSCDWCEGPIPQGQVMWKDSAGAWFCHYCATDR